MNPSLGSRRGCEVRAAWVAWPLFACAVAALPPAFADERAAGPDSYGTASDIVYTIQAYQFIPYIGASSNVIANGFGSRACTGGCRLVAPVLLPSGAKVNRVEIEACDNDPSGDLDVEFYRQGPLESTFEILGGITTVQTPGCMRLGPFFAPHTIDNLNSSYAVEVLIDGTTIETRFQAVRLYYRLQVSPAPATATFPNDVPTTHPFFRFVEALARAGITGGCAAGSYCPDAPVSRGQMAVFLATALGLHFPN
jgi:hypothetical protein